MSQKSSPHGCSKSSRTKGKHDDSQTTLQQMKWILPFLCTWEGCSHACKFRYEIKEHIRVEHFNNTQAPDEVINTDRFIKKIQLFE